MLLIFSGRTSFGALVTRLEKNHRWMDDVVDVILEGVIDVDSSNGTYI